MLTGIPEHCSYFFLAAVSNKGVVCHGKHMISVCHNSVRKQSLVDKSGLCTVHLDFLFLRYGSINENNSRNPQQRVEKAQAFLTTDEKNVLEKLKHTLQKENHKQC